MVYVRPYYFIYEMAIVRSVIPKIRALLRIILANDTNGNDVLFDFPLHFDDDAIKRRSPNRIPKLRAEKMSAE